MSKLLALGIKISRNIGTVEKQSIVCITPQTKNNHVMFQMNKHGAR